MQTVETLNEGLKRAYTLKITAKDIDSRVDAEVKRVAPQVKMPGFRPGKVPTNLVRKMHGEALAQDALNSSIQEGIQQLLSEHKLRPAMQPSVSLEGDYEAGKDAEIKVELEVLPDVPTPSIDGLKLDRLTVPADEAAVNEQLEQLASQQKSWEDAAAKHKAATGDQVTMDFVGKTADGVAFEGGTGTDMSVEIGTGRLIPGFEDQLVGVKAGDEKTINVTFPEDYGSKDLAGKPATFDLKITSVKTAGETKIDDDFAKALGLQSLEQLNGLLKGQIEQQLNGLTRTYMKRKLLDQLAAGHDFPVPPSMVDAEFQQIWHQLVHETEHEADPAAALAELEAERDDYLKIAERRVRLGLLLSEIGTANGIEVTQAGNEPARRPGLAAIRPRGSPALHAVSAAGADGRRAAPCAAVRGQGRRLPVREGRDQRARSDSRGAGSRDRERRGFLDRHAHPRSRQSQAQGEEGGQEGREAMQTTEGRGAGQEGRDQEGACQGRQARRSSG
jgi:trigger factor